MNSWRKSVKYAFIGKITLRNQLAYVADFLIRSLFLLLILYIFLQLWQTTFHSEGTEIIAGFSFKQIMWYLVITESMILACPSLCSRVEEEVKSGDIVFKFVRPVSFVAFHYVEYMSEAAIRFLVNAALGGLLGLLIMGPPDFGYWVTMVAHCGIVRFHGKFHAEYGFSAKLFLGGGNTRTGIRLQQIFIHDWRHADASGVIS